MLSSTTLHASRLEAVARDIRMINLDLQNAGLLVEIVLFGSAKDSVDVSNDVDLAIIVKDTDMESALTRIRFLGRSIDRQMDWKIDLFDPKGPTFGYNGKGSSPLHLLLITEEQLRLNNPLCLQIYAASLKMPPKPC